MEPSILRSFFSSSSLRCRVAFCQSRTYSTNCHIHKPNGCCPNNHAAKLQQLRWFAKTPSTVFTKAHVSSFSTTSSSATKEEVAKFSKLSESWWDPMYNPLIGMNPIRVEFMTKFLAQPQRRHHQQSTTSIPVHDAAADAIVIKKATSCGVWNDLTVLDVGCGGGLLSESLARLGAKVVALDPSQTLIDMARQHSQLDPKTRQNIDYRGGITLEEFCAMNDDALSSSSEPKSNFDVICLLEVLEHVENVDSVLRAAASLLKPTGTLFVSTVNRTWKSQALAIVGAEYIMGYLPVGTHDWNKFISPQDMEQHVLRATTTTHPLVPVNVCGMVLTQPPPPLGTGWSWKLNSNDLDVNWIGAYQRID